MKKLLEINNLSTSFITKEGEVQAVRDVSFSIRKGEVLAILGESGSGKSVLCKSILHILPENGFIKSGNVIFDGKNLENLSQNSMDEVRGKDISMILQDPTTALNPTMSIGKQIVEAVLIHNRISKKEAKQKSIELMKLVGIDNAVQRFNQYPYQFSGGMKQRIVIAIALASGPKLLIADEPTTALDVTIQTQILDLIKELQLKLGLSIIFITHDLGVASNIAQRIAVMYAGKIVEIGTTEEIFYDPRHPYTWGLMSSLPNENSEEEFLYSIPGMPPSGLRLPKGDAFAQRNRYALKIDYLIEPPMFKISDTHSAATWLLHKDAPQIDRPINFREYRVI